MTFPTFIDEVAFASDPLANPQVYTDISGRASVRTFGRGRQSEGDTPDTGTSTQTFENSDRALDSQNAASPYYPNVKPMRRTRCRVAEVIPADAGPLTVSGNEVTDAVRAADLLLGITASGNMCDGRTSDSSFGVRRAATNLFRRGQCDALGSGSDAWTTGGSGGVMSWVVDATPTPPFSTQSVKITVDGANNNQGTFASAGGSWAAGTRLVGAIYFKGVAGKTYKHSLNYSNGTVERSGASTQFVATGAWQLLTPTANTVQVGDTAVAIRLYVQTTTAVADTFWVAHAMIEAGQALVAPYVATSGGSTATHAAGRVQAPASLVTPAQGWIAFRVRVGYASGARSDNPEFLSLSDGTTSNRIQFRHGAGAGQWIIDILSGGAGGNNRNMAAAFAAGDLLTIVVAWSGGTANFWVNGVKATGASGAFTAPVSLTQFDIGSSTGSGLTGREIDSDILWLACGAGRLTDADAVSVNAMGNTATDASDLLWGSAADVSMVWQAATTTYRVPSDAILFTNFIDPEQGWQLAQVGPAQMNAIAPANDAFDLLGTFKFDAFASFPQQYAGQRVAAILDAYGWPATERDLDLSTNGQSQVQAATAGSLRGVSALAAIQAAAANDNGVFYIDGRGYAVFRGRHRQTDSRYTMSQAVFTDKANWLPGYYLYDPGLTPAESPIRNDYRVTRAGGTQMTWSDPTSILHYGDRTKEADTLHISDAEALNYAQYRVALDKDPHRRYDEMTVTPGDDANFWLLVLSLQLGDRVTVIQSPPGGGSPDVRDMHIEAIRARIGPEATAQWTYRLSPADDQVGWVLGDAVYGLLGSTTALTY